MGDDRHVIVGSSPRVRGLLYSIGIALSALRIIPARAGFTGESEWHSLGYMDHPRACGVYEHSLFR